jgi:hypothetical protein
MTATEPPSGENTATFDALRAGLAAGQVVGVLDELLHRLSDAMKQSRKSELPRWRREALLHKSTFALIEQRKREGTATATDEAQLRRLMAATLDLIDTIERQAKDLPVWFALPRLAAASPPATHGSPMPGTASSVTATDEAIFVSYKRENRAAIEPLVAILRGRGWSVFWDPLIVPGTANWDMLLERKLKAARCILVLWSSQAAESEFVRTEAHYGRNNRTLMAVTLDGVVPATFALIQTVDLSGWSGAQDDARIQEILKGIERLLA